MFGLSEDRRVHLETEPAGAQVWVNGKLNEELTPCWLSLEPGVDHLVEAHLEDAQGVVFRGRTHSICGIQPWRVLWDYLLPLGSVWVTIDYFTGALHEFESERLVLRLQPNRLPAQELEKPRPSVAQK